MGFKVVQYTSMGSKAARASKLYNTPARAPKLHGLQSCTIHQLRALPPLLWVTANIGSSYDPLPFFQKHTQLHGFRSTPMGSEVVMGSEAHH
jgi:hypothetical protein